VSDDPNAAAPAEEYPIDFSNEPASTKRDPKAKSSARGELPAPESGDHARSRPVPSSRAGDFWALVGCNAIVFGASVCIMVLELTASRLIANYIGQSLYTWTSVIGVVLAGISMGNYLGGWLADNYPPQKVLSWLFGTSGVLTFSVLFFNNWASSAQRPPSIDWPLWVMLIVAWVFFLPALSLGTISPVTASIALKRSARTGITVGNIYAWGALGSILGTFLTGFWLIGHFGSHQVIWMTACALVIMGVLVAGGQRFFRGMALFGALPLIVQFGILSSVTGEKMSNLCRNVAGIRSGWKTTDADFEADREAQKVAGDNSDERALEAARAKNVWRTERKNAEIEWSKWGAKLGRQLHELGRTLSLRNDNPDEYNDESNYYSINIAKTHVEGDVVKELRLDHLIHSYWNPEQPGKLYYDYEQVYAAVTERAAAMPGKATKVSLESLPGSGNLSAMFPPGIAYDRDSKTLSVQGTMQFSQLQRMLTIGPYAEFAQAMFSTWDQAWHDWYRASRRGGGVLVTDLRQLPDGITFPPAVALKVHYDSVLKSLVCTGSFTLPDLMDVLAQGEMQEYVEAVWMLFNDSRQTSALFIGGGGFVFPRWIEQTFPHEPLIDVAEIDPAVKTAIERELGLPTQYGSPAEGKTYIRTHLGDARKFVDDQLRENERRVAAGEAPTSYDFVYGDAFNDLSVPWHLTTLEFSDKIARLLTPRRGVYLVNIIDIYPRAKFTEGTDGHSRTPAVFPGEPPAGLAPPVPLNKNVWTPGLSQFGGLQLLKAGDDGYSLGFRGVMEDATRDRLLQEAGADGRFTAAILDLYRKSREEQVGQFLGRYLNTVRKIFPYVYLFTSNKGPVGESRDTFIVACSLQRLNFENLAASGDYWHDGPFAWVESDASGQRHDYGEMPSVLELARNHILTDTFAPLDNLLAPVFVNRSTDD
jgi:hypothetical protein